MSSLSNRWNESSIQADNESEVFLPSSKFPNYGPKLTLKKKKERSVTFKNDWPFKNTVCEIFDIIMSFLSKRLWSLIFLEIIRKFMVAWYIYIYILHTIMFLLLNFIVLKLRTYNLKQNDKNVLFINKQVCLYCSQVAYNKKKIP